MFGSTAGGSIKPTVFNAAIAGTALIMELTRRVAGMALVVIGLVFLVYVFAGPYLPGFLGYPGLSVQRFFSQVYTDAGILGPTTAVSSTYIILFISFAAFLQASKVGDYFVNFAFAAAGRSRGGPAKVAIFASGLMGMINGTSAGNVVSTGSLTIPLMKKVGYSKKSAGAVEAAASTGGQIMPPIMGAGAFIMAEITGIPYTEIAIAAIIPAILYFASVYFMVDFEAKKLGMRGMREDEVDAVLAHEISHIANGDMVTLALIQGVVNTFVIFLSRVVGYFVDRVILRNEEGMGIGFFLSSLVAQIVLGILASTIVMWFSRRREFSADSGGATLAGRQNMIAALQRLQQVHTGPLPEKMAAFGIAGGVGGGLKRLFMTHPPLEERIAALQGAR